MCTGFVWKLPKVWRTLSLITHYHYYNNAHLLKPVPISFVFFKSILLKNYYLDSFGIKELWLWLSKTIVCFLYIVNCCIYFIYFFAIGRPTLLYPKQSIPYIVYVCLCVLPCNKYSIMLIVPPVTGITVTGGASILCPGKNIFTEMGGKKRAQINKTFNSSIFVLQTA